MKKIWNYLVYVPNAVAAFLRPYPLVARALLTGWVAFSTSWATGIGVPLNLYGLSLQINAKAWVVALQSAAHIPTWAAGIFMAAFGGIVALGNFEVHKNETGS